jgi:hypothetical protein
MRAGGGVARDAWLRHLARSPAVRLPAICPRSELAWHPSPRLRLFGRAPVSACRRSCSRPTDPLGRGLLQGTLQHLPDPARSNGNRTPLVGHFPVLEPVGPDQENMVELPNGVMSRMDKELPGLLTEDEFLARCAPFVREGDDAKEATEGIRRAGSRTPARADGARSNRRRRGEGCQASSERDQIASNRTDGERARCLSPAPLATPPPVRTSRVALSAVRYCFAASLSLAAAASGLFGYRCTRAR